MGGYWNLPCQNWLLWSDKRKNAMGSWKLKMAEWQLWFWSFVLMPSDWKNGGRSGPASGTTADWSNSNMCEIRGVQSDLKLTSIPEPRNSWNEEGNQCPGSKKFLTYYETEGTNYVARLWKKYKVTNSSEINFFLKEPEVLRKALAPLGITPITL